MKFIKHHIAAAAALLALTACGGGGHHDAAADNAAAVPASALASAEAFSRWVASLMADDTREPLSLTDVTPPKSNSEEPIAVN